MTLSITFLQIVTLFIGSTLAYLIARENSRVWVQAIGFLISFIGSWALGVTLWAFFLVHDEYTSAIVLGLSRSFLSALVGPIIGVAIARRIEGRKIIEAQVANDGFISAFHRMPISKLRTMSLVELDEAVSLATTDPVRRQLVFSEIHRRRSASQNLTMAIIAFSSTAFGALIGGYFQIAPFGQQKQVNQNIAAASLAKIQCISLTPEEDADFNRFSKYSPNPAAGYASAGYYYYLEEKYSNYQACLSSEAL